MPSSITNRVAFLKMIALSEGTGNSKYTRNHGYDVVVSGINSPNTFTDYSKHPNILVTVNSKGLKSTAAGRYQLLYRYWVAYCAKLGLSDFTPLSQDRIALQQIREQGGLPYIDAGQITTAIQKCSNIWASFPGAGYGQNEHAIETLLNYYTQAGGVLSQ